MSVVLFTPTIRPGLDVSVESVKRQTVRPDVWIISDHLLNRRSQGGVYKRVQAEVPDVCLEVFNPCGLTDRPYTIQAAYNWALDYCRAPSVDLLVTMEDYIWLPADGIDRFISMTRSFPDFLLGGIISGSLDPPPSAVADPAGLYTIFAEPYASEPRLLDWTDCRLDRGTTGYQVVETQRWEPGFAAIPKAILDDEEIWFNEEYDQGTTHGNQWFSAVCNDHGFPTMLDLENRAWALPHRYYWPEQRHDGLTRGDNKALHERNKKIMGWPDA